MTQEMKIKKGDIVLHTLSGNHYRCENAKQERWMNMNPYYVLVDKDVVIINYSNKKESNGTSGLSKRDY